MRRQLRTEVELPDSYPDDAPMYPGALTNNAGRRNGRVTAVFSTEDGTEQVAAYLTAKIAAQGWKLFDTTEMPNGSVMNATKNDRRLSLLISSMDEGTEYELTMIIVAVDP